jgi:hypothetical protein
MHFSVLPWNLLRSVSAVMTSSESIEHLVSHSPFQYLLTELLTNLMGFNESFGLLLKLKSLLSYDLQAFYWF